MPGVVNALRFASSARSRAALALTKPARGVRHVVSVGRPLPDRDSKGKESLDTLEAIDQMVGVLETAMRAEDPTNAIVCVVSDHGFATSVHRFAIRQAFVTAGLMKVDPSKPPAIADWTAAPWTSGGGAFIVLKDSNDAPLREKVRMLLNRLASDPANGIEHVLDRQEIAGYGGTSKADFLRRIPKCARRSSWLGPESVGAPISATWICGASHQRSRSCSAHRCLARWCRLSTCSPPVFPSANSPSPSQAVV